MNENHLAVLRRHMVEVIAIKTDLISDELGKTALNERVLAAMQRVPRHLFVPAPLAPHAYVNSPLPIGFDKTISQPFIAALMTDLLSPGQYDCVLEVGTGLGYQAAVLAEMVDRVWSVEIVEELATQAEARLRELGYSKVAIRVGDGLRGWAEHGPYDKILVTAAAAEPPPALIEQLKPGGRLVLPMGGAEAQFLTTIDKEEGNDICVRQLIPVRFGPLETVATGRLSPSRCRSSIRSRPRSTSGCG